ncbi:hypothetical protein [Pseudomonas sp. 2835]|uniref:hypothetical protein n=1 Tax=Pseudomonas sp. 2835 TaxID=3156451 RepID=UPI003D248F12
MYLLIFEDGEMKSAEDVTDDELRGADDGLLDIVDISEPFTPTRYVGGQWVDVEGVND